MGLIAIIMALVALALPGAGQHMPYVKGKPAACPTVQMGAPSTGLYVYGCTDVPSIVRPKGCPPVVNGVRPDIYMVGCDDGVKKLDDLIDKQPLCSKAKPCVTKPSG